MSNQKLFIKFEINIGFKSSAKSMINFDNRTSADIYCTKRLNV